MDISAFYEVRDRLYNAALAGSSIIKEDFRLKRAVEGLAELAEKGKVFAALKQKCEKLLEAGPDASSQLADCIALADAVAVTLGQNGVPEGGESVGLKEHAGIWEQEPPVGNVTYREMQEALELLRKGSENTLKISDKYPEVLTDIRFGRAVADGLNGKASEYGDRFAAIVLEICGDGLKEIIKDSLDLNDESAKGRQIKIIASVYGSKDSAWYQELAQNESISQKVRLEAISALSCSTANEDVLMELYKTGKGKIKSAALESLARSGAAGIDNYFEKMLAKEDFSGSDEELIRVSPSETAAACVWKYVQLCEADNKKPPKMTLLERKTGPVAAEAFFRMLKLMNKGRRTSGSSILIGNLIEGIPGADELIEQLYQKSPERFSGAYAYCGLVNGTLSVSDLMRVQDMIYGNYCEDDKCPARYKFASEMLRSIRLIPVLGEYRVEWTRGYEFLTRKIGKELPQAILDVLTDPAALKSFNAAAECCVSLSKLCLSSDPATRALCEDTVNGAYSVGPWEHERIMKAAIPFLEKAIEAHPSLYYGTLVHKLITDTKGRVDLYYEFLCKNVEIQSLRPSVSPGAGWRGSPRVEIADHEQMVKEYQYAKDQMNKMFSKIGKEDKLRIMRVIDEVI